HLRILLALLQPQRQVLVQRAEVRDEPDPAEAAAEGIHGTTRAGRGIRRLGQRLVLVINRLVDTQRDEALPADLRLRRNLQANQVLAASRSAELLLYVVHRLNADGAGVAGRHLLGLAVLKEDLSVLPNWLERLCPSPESDGRLGLDGGRGLDRRRRLGGPCSLLEFGGLRLISGLRLG